MDLKLQKRLASSVFKAGTARVKFDQNNLDKISQAITKDDIRAAEAHGYIVIEQKKGVSRARANYIMRQKAKGRRKGKGKRTGTKFACMSSKRHWISRIRPLRRRLVELRETDKINAAMYRKLYLLAKGNFFRDKGHLMTYLRDNEIIKE